MFRLIQNGCSDWVRICNSGATNVSQSNVRFSWYSSGATSYRLVISQNSSFSGFRDVNGSSTCDSTCFTTATSSTSYTKSMDLAGKTYYWKVRANNSSGASLFSGYRTFTTAGTPSARLSLPFSSGQTWYVCQGYNGSISHNYGGRNTSLDLSVSSASYAGGSGCTPGTSSSSQNYSVIAPDNGKVAWIGSTDKDIMCLALDSGGRIKLGHFYSKVSTGSRVTRNSTVLGYLNAPYVGTNGGYSHIHMQLFSDSACSSSTAFGAVFGSPNLSYSGATNQWAGTALKK